MDTFSQAAALQAEARAAAAKEAEAKQSPQTSKAKAEDQAPTTGVICVNLFFGDHVES